MFWNREQLPPELRDKKPEEIVAALNRLKELEASSADFDKAKTELESRLNSTTTEFEQTKTRLQELEALANEQRNPPPPPDNKQEPPTIWTNPDAYIDQKLGGVTAASLAAIRLAAGMKFQQGLSGRDRKIFDKYSNEIEQVMNTYPPAYQGVPQNWQTSFIYIKGLHEQDLAKQDADSPFFSEPGARGGHEEPPPPAETKLTDEEEEVVRRFHWDRDGYLKRKKEMVIAQSEKGAHARFPVPERRAS